MKPPVLPKQTLLYSANLLEQLNLRHPLLLLAGMVPWLSLDEKFSREFKTMAGRPAIPTRTIIGLLLLKYLYDESDESACERFVENPYWQAFCGYHEFQHKAPCDPSSLVRWRKKMGSDLEIVLKASLEAAKNAGALKEKMLHEIIADTTVQEKAVTYPTDALLLVKMQKRLLREAKRRGIKLPRTHWRAAKRALIRHGRLLHAKQHKKAKKEMRKLRTCLRRVSRMIAREMAGLTAANVSIAAEAAQAGLYESQNEKNQFVVNEMSRELLLAERVMLQSRGKVEPKNRIYSLHAPEVECIAKGKARKKFEFGCKVALAATAKGSFITASNAVHENPYDGRTLTGTVNQVERMTGIRPYLCGADKGYRGKRHHPPGTSILIAGTRRLGGKLKRFMRRRNAIEPIIGHAKFSHRMDRNYLLGETGDKINALLSAAAWNLAQTLRHLRRKARALSRLLAMILKFRLPAPENPLYALPLAA